MNRMLCLAIVLILLGHTPAGADDGGWKLVKERDAIRVYNRDVPGSAIDEFKGVGIVDARLEVLAAILRDVEAAEDWMADTVHAEKIKQLEGEDMIVLNITKLPWPLKRRESLVHIVVSMDYRRGYAVIDMRGIDDAQLRPVAENHVRMKYVHAAVILEYVDREHTRVTYTAKLDPGGVIPIAVANLVVVRIPFESISALRRLAAQEKFVIAGRNSRDRAIIDENVALGYLKP
ncbi:MAG: START domain-containing protein [Syntrophaceae bacterium]